MVSDYIYYTHYTFQHSGAHLQRKSQQLAYKHFKITDKITAYNNLTK